MDAVGLMDLSGFEATSKVGHAGQATGVSDGYVRLSVGIEHIDDIIADIERGLAASGALARAA